VTTRSCPTLAMPRWATGREAAERLRRPMPLDSGRDTAERCRRGVLEYGEDSPGNIADPPTKTPAFAASENTRSESEMQTCRKYGTDATEGLMEQDVPSPRHQHQGRQTPDYQCALSAALSELVPPKAAFVCSCLGLSDIEALPRSGRGHRRFRVSDAFHRV
jgi:hypothetical protein